MGDFVKVVFAGGDVYRRARAPKSAAQFAAQMNHSKLVELSMAKHRIESGFRDRRKISLLRLSSSVSGCARPACVRPGTYYCSGQNSRTPDARRCVSD